jgi:hypothetical protein
LVLEGVEFLDSYRRLARKVISKQVYNSVKGMALHNYKKYQNELGDKLDSRRWDKIVRVINFGIRLMETGEISFLPVYNSNIDTYNSAMNDLEDAKNNGILQEYPTETDIGNLWDFVVSERVKRL